MTTTERVLRTELCSLLDIRYPILLAGMGRASMPELVAAVSNAGGLGVLGATGLTLEETEANIKQVQRLTSQTFGVDIVLPITLIGAPPGAGDDVPKESVAFVHGLLREAGVQDPEKYVDPNNTVTAWSGEHFQRQVEIVLEMRVPVFVSGLGSPGFMVQQAHQQGMKVLALVGNVKNARRVAAAGVDAVIAQGHEAGGHTGRIGTMALVPQAVDAVRPTPLVASGGIADGRGLAASLALGACGVWCGTAFLATPEAAIPDYWKDAVLRSTEEDTRVTRIYSGKTLRHLVNKWMESWEQAGGKTLPMPIQGRLTRGAEHALASAQKWEYLSGAGGQIAGMLTELKPAAQVVEEMAHEAIRVLEERLPALLGGGPGQRHPS